VCWIHSDQTSPTGYEHWWWKTGFSPPAQAPNSEVVWKVRRDVYGVDDWDTWQADHGPDAPLPEQRTSVWVVHETRSEQP
jgi:hypothetical protein